MKTLLYLLLFNIGTIASAQDPQLFENTWYLYSMQPNDMDPIYIVSEIEPPINPYLIINENLEFYGEGACNSFNGVYEAFGQNFLTTIDFVETSEDCGIQNHNTFEDGYFYVVREFSYTITQDGTGLVLEAYTTLMGQNIFKSYPLSTSDFSKNEFQLYPNPAKTELYLNSKNTTGNLKLKIFNIEGKLLSTQTVAIQNQTAIDVSILPCGIYFLNVEDENGNTAIKKFIKE